VATVIAFQGAQKKTAPHRIDAGLNVRRCRAGAADQITPSTMAPTKKIAAYTATTLNRPTNGAMNVVMGELSLSGVAGRSNDQASERFPDEKVSDADPLSRMAFAVRRRTWLKKREIKALKSL
jgi:hypothetical protein